MVRPVHIVFVAASVLNFCAALDGRKISSIAISIAIAADKSVSLTEAAQEGVSCPLHFDVVILEPREEGYIYEVELRWKSSLHVGWGDAEQPARECLEDEVCVGYAQNLSTDFEKYYVLFEKAHYPHSPYPITLDEASEELPQVEDSEELDQDIQNIPLDIPPIESGLVPQNQIICKRVI